MGPINLGITGSFVAFLFFAIGAIGWFVIELVLWALSFVTA